MEKMKKAGAFALRGLLLNRTLYRAVLLFIALFCAVPFIHAQVGRYVKVLLVWGAVLLVYDLFTKRLALKSKYALLFLWFSASYGVTILLNGNRSDNFAQLCYMIVFMFLLYSYDLEESKESKWREIRLLSYMVIGITALLSAACFVTFLFSINRTYPLNGSNMFIGMWENRLWGLYNPNTGSTLNMVSIVLSVLFLYKENSRRGTKVFLWINMVLQWLCLVMTQSRTAWYTLVLFFGLFVFFRLAGFKRMETWKRGARLAVRGAAAVLTAALLLVSQKPVKQALSYVPGTIQYMMAKTPAGEVEEKPSSPSITIEPIDIDRIELKQEGKRDITNGRMALWKGGIKVFLAHPLFGVGRENIPKEAKPFIVERLHPTLGRGGLHNIYLTTLVSAGLMGFIPLALFVILAFVDMLKILFSRGGCADADKLYVWIPLLLCLFVADFFEARILFVFGPFSALLWIFFGFTMYYCEMARLDAGVDVMHNRLLYRAARRFGGSGKKDGSVGACTK